MNSFNHYAYGAVCDWIYGVAAGIMPDFDNPGYKHFTVTPHPDKRLGFINCALDTPMGRVESNWYYKGDVVYYEITVPAGATASVALPNGYRATLTEGTYHFSE